MKLSKLQLGIEVTDNPDWPEVTIAIDGVDPFRTVAREWRGFGPEDILSVESPLVPADTGRRVAVRRCSCGEAGCGVIAPLVIAAPDRSAVVWTDFRDYTGVFDGPTVDEPIGHEGTPWSLPEFRFDPTQYLDEVRRATADPSWETPRRRTARLLEGSLGDLGLTVPGGRLHWVAPAYRAEGYVVSFWRTDEQGSPPRQVLLHLYPTAAEPGEAVQQMVSQLIAVDPWDWPWRFQ